MNALKKVIQLLIDFSVDLALFSKNPSQFAAFQTFNLCLKLWNFPLGEMSKVGYENFPRNVHVKSHKTKILLLWAQCKLNCTWTNDFQFDLNCSHQGYSTQQSCSNVRFGISTRIHITYGKFSRFAIGSH